MPAVLVFIMNGVNFTGEGSPLYGLIPAETSLPLIWEWFCGHHNPYSISYYYYHYYYFFFWSVPRNKLSFCPMVLKYVVTPKGILAMCNGLP